MKYRFDVTLLVLSMIICYTQTLKHSNSILKSFRTHKNRVVLSAFSSLIMDIPVVIRGLKEISHQYDVFLFDQFGVLHDGHTVFEGVKESLQYLKQQNKTLALVSNTSRRVCEAHEMLQQRGFDLDTFDLTFTSGELAWKFLLSKATVRSSSLSSSSPSESSYTNAVIDSPPRFSKCCFFSFAHQVDATALSSIGIECVNVEDAHFILLHGTQLLHTGSRTPFSLNMYETGEIDETTQQILTVALSRNIPIICANGDMTAINKNKTQYMPGVIANAYEAMGGVVMHFGKPHSIMFEAAIETSLDFHRYKQQQLLLNNDDHVAQLSSLQIIEIIEMLAKSKKQADKDVILLKTNQVSSSSSSSVVINQQPLGSIIRQEMSTTMNAKLKQTLRRKERLRVLNIGDSLHHDILGAKRAKIDSLLVTRHGVHRDIFTASSDASASATTTTVNNRNDDDHPYYKGSQHNHDALGDKSLLFKVCDYCDAESLPRPTHIITHIKL